MNKRFTQSFNDGLYKANISVSIYTDKPFVGWAHITVPCMLTNTEDYSITRPVGLPQTYVIKNQLFILPVKSIEETSYGYFTYLDDIVGLKDKTVLIFYECITATNHLKVFVIEDPKSIA